MSREETKREKAHRLIRNGRVKQITYGRMMEMYEVKGDSGTYTVTRRNDKNGQMLCECDWAKYHPFGEHCSHTLAVSRMRERSTGTI